jgi:hypothetical protein
MPPSIEPLYCQMHLLRPSIDRRFSFSHRKQSAIYNHALQSAMIRRGESTFCPSQGIKVRVYTGNYLQATSVKLCEVLCFWVEVLV